MATRVQRQTIFSKQTTLLDGVGFGPPKWCVYGRGLNESAHEDMNGNSISNV